jgi:hypothetical protein
MTKLKYLKYSCLQFYNVDDAYKVINLICTEPNVICQSKQTTQQDGK